MENRKHEILLHLYGEAPEDSDLRELLRDEELRSEYQALSEVKFRLDHMRPVRPDPAVLDAVMSRAAGAPEAGTRRWGDRPPAPRGTSLRRLLVPALSIAAALVVAFGLGWWANDPVGVTPPAAEASRSDMPVPPESLHRYVPPVRGSVPGIRQAAAKDPRLAWDEPELLDMWSHRIESLEAASDPDGWGAPAVPLEMLPGESTTSGIVPAGARRNRR
jgi:hypothetical protein